MCGLGAIYNLKEDQFKGENLLDKMMNEVKDRGPDSYNKFLSNSISFGHRRLSIIDLNKSSEQPFLFKNRYYLIFNGAIYNYLELKVKLESNGYKFLTKSDTEVLIASYDFWGEDCLNKFNGMWSFIIWDKNNKKLFVSRDRFGIKPLYWALKDNKLFFSSEIKQMRSIGLGSEANLDEVSTFIYTGMVDTSDQTFFRGIRQIPAGHNLIVNKNKKIKIKKWYSLIESSSKQNKKDILSLIDDSIKLRLRSDVNLGILLSGGIDSSFLTSRLNLLKNKFKIFHGSSIDKEFDESNFAKLLSKSIKKNLNIKKPTKEEFWQNINKVCYLQDEPFGTPSIFMQYFTLEEANKNNCRVILDGQGADELLLGYKRYMILPMLNRIKILNFKKFITSLKYLLIRNKNLTIWQKMEYIFGQLFFQLRIFRIRKKYNFINISSSKSEKIYKDLSNKYWNHRSLQISEIYKYSLPSLLRFADRSSMSNSIELRLPYLDHRVVEKCLSLKLNEKINNGWDKFPLRNSDRIIKEIAWRESKLGFASPSKTWINAYSNEMYAATISSKFINKIANINKLKLKWKYLNYNEKWRLFNLAIWSKNFKIE